MNSIALQHILRLRVALHRADFYVVADKFFRFGCYLNNCYPECDDICDLQKHVRETIFSNKAEDIMRSLPATDYDIDNLQAFIEARQRSYEEFACSYDVVPANISYFYEKMRYGFYVFCDLESMIKPELNDEDAIANGGDDHEKLVRQIALAIETIGAELEKDSGDRVKNLRRLCHDYERHLKLSAAGCIHKNMRHKLDAAHNLRTIVDSDNGADVAKLANFASELNRVKPILSSQRDAKSKRLLANMVHIITFGVIAKLRKGTFCFWQAHGNVVAKKAEHVSLPYQSFGA